MTMTYSMTPHDQMSAFLPSYWSAIRTCAAHVGLSTTNNSWHVRVER